jgi:hypothetical protein
MKLYPKNLAKKKSAINFPQKENYNTVAYRTVARQTPRNKQPGKHVPAANVMHAAGETECCLSGPRRGVIKRRIGADSSVDS